MYSQAIRKFLERVGVKAGDRVEIEKKGKIYQGILMPRPETGDPNCLVLKLPSGYNLGIAFEKGIKIRKLKAPTEKARKPKPPKFRKDLPGVTLFAVGGTIGSRVDYRTGGVYALMEPEEFLFNLPELSEIARLESIQRPFTKMSEDMDPKDWQVLAKEVAKKLNREADGVVIAHGTDTMHFTSAALSFMLRNLSKPVVLTGSQRSSDRPSSDAGMNLICSCWVARSDIAEVGICMHATSSDDYCHFLPGTKARKLHSTRRDAFRPINSKPIARVWPDGRLETLTAYRKRSDSQVEADVKFEERVALIKAYPGSDPALLEFLASKGYRGIVIEGTGLGHVPTQARKSWIPAIKKLVKDGIPVVITTQTLYGRVNPWVYTNLRILFSTGAISGEDMLPETAYVKLGWVLGHTQDPEEVRKLMLQNLAGEIKERSLPDTFLI
ncbi:MAG: Glu-tRNA(Gln) amidotransferase GatDE subunit D [Candidatus Aenigmatarchaeota archaeon]|nr:MAG: Glu-tRNA(Gln) amidotransferase GatDE subunit D [Candidatus Aenigmarchaeota archaeon]